ncbi:phosphoribosylaminoimidazole-succinocarboxamide synthase [Paenibacillus anaericanus]|uniref:phosphoribosylaminoimidazolesuccinocarboxamide synthase n=1 Tax=Paenibacillus anaericanus TaxID=170367 RepID=UPI0027830292|nr:phosphoribosylaminoimidazolesuccinocarboxamide synthase [Paenibacillus anaericanus]MDQ0091477.1 phosphoribosylaminoimidazole-succinocarboxamide synthase [Paenibacillus anaericanus]
MSSPAISTAEDIVNAPLLYKGKVRELYDLGDYYLIVVTDRISAFDYVLDPAVPDKGNVLNQLSSFWFEKTKDLIENHVIHTNIEQLGSVINEEHKPILKNRVMVTRKAQRIDIECVVRGYVTGGGWRQYVQNGEINGINLPKGLRKNDKLREPIFTPAAKNDVGHDEDISFEAMVDMVGNDLAEQLRSRSLEMYKFARDYCEERNIILADCKLEFGLVDGKLILIDEIFTPDASRFWARENYALDIEIDSMDKEPVRTYLLGSDWDKNSKPDPLPLAVVEETTRRYRDIFKRLTKQEIS